MILFTPILAAFIFTGEAIETARYLRPAGKQFETECEFKFTRTPTGTRIESSTIRGKLGLDVTARYDPKECLLDAAAVLVNGDKKSFAAVTVAGGKAVVKREGQPAQEFEVPKGVIVTSAPDWTDVWMLCRRFDRVMGGKQEFAGLWIHPVMPSQRLTFTMERTGANSIEHAGKKLTLDRYAIRLRGNSAYAAWADERGRLIKLVPLPAKLDALNWIVLQGFEASTAKLRP